MSTKYVPPAMKTKIPDIIDTPSVTTKMSKLLPFICAGAAVGVSILALKELKKIKSEMIVIKSQQIIPQNNVPDQTLSKKMDLFEDQLKRINGYLSNNNPKDRKIIKNAFKSNIPKDIKIINQPEPAEENVEYEEVEVTDDDENEEEMQEEAQSD